MPPRSTAEEFSSPPLFNIPQTLLSPQSQQLQSLYTNHKLLLLVHHRNKNQYRRSLWYGHFNLFRRETKKLCLDLQIDMPGAQPHERRPSGRPKQKQPKKSPAQTKKQKHDAAQRAATLRLSAWLDAGFVERWYTAFTTLLATPSSSPLALTLLGILARVCGVTGLTAHIQSVAEHESAEKLTHAREGESDRGAEAESGAFGEALGSYETVEVQRESFAGGGEKRAKGVAGIVDDEDDDDVGVAVARSEVVDDTVGLAAASTESQERRAKPVAKVKKKRKKGNAIDDLFAGLS